MFRVALHPVGGYVLTGAIVALLVVLLIVLPLRTPLARNRRRILVAIRLGVILLVLAALLRPTIVYTSSKRQASTLVILADKSRSMQTRDSLGNESRWEALRSVMGDAAPVLDKLSDDVEIKVYTFAGDLSPTNVADGDAHLEKVATGSESAIGAALADMLRREAGKRLAGVVLLTDGAQRALPPHDLPPQTAARQLRDLGFLLHTVVFGQSRAADAARDIALADLHANDSVFVKNELSVAATTRVSGFAHDNLPVDLLFETAPGQMTVVASTQVRARADGDQLPVELTYIPETPGEFKVTLRARPQPGELTPTNNELSTFVTVRQGGINVLYLEGAHPVEAKFIRRALEAGPDVHVEYHWIDARRPQTRPAELSSAFERGKYNVYILGDLDSTAFAGPELAKLADTVRAGAGLLMIGGLHSFGPGGYQKTPLAEVLPIQMGDLERQGFDDPPATDLHVPGPLKMQPTAAGEQLRVLLLGPVAQNRDTWALLPPLEGANRFRGLAPLASVLAESAAAPRVPLLVAQTPGNGRVLAFAGDSTWHWALGGQDALHKRFWRQLVLWLAKKDQSDSEVWVELPQRRYRPASRVEFSAGVQAVEGADASAVAMEAEITLPDGSRRPLRLGRQQERFSGVFLEANAAGDYTVTVKATRNGQPLGTASARFLVEVVDLELESPQADPNLLTQLANITGGEAMVAEQLGSFLERLEKQPPAPLVTIEAKQEPWDTWPFLLAFAALLIGEWALRKRWGLV
ncbi:MAG: glutamine amidotransferase [Pirellulales bacterium]|nr:glutamine amidotransferase [Pirellulales bacterium]